MRTINCGYCFTRYPVENLGDHGRGVCDVEVTSELKQASAAAFELWEKSTDTGDFGWADLVEAVASDQHPTYDDLDVVENEAHADEAQVLEEKAERDIVMELLQRIAWSRGIWISVGPLPPDAARCGHPQWGEGPRCGEMSCFNYVMKART